MKPAASVFNSCNDEYRENVFVNQRAVAAHPRGIELEGDTVAVDLDRTSLSLDDILTKKGTPMAPDEFLQSRSGAVVKIPVRQRHQFPENNPLPDSDTLKVLHYYSSQRSHSQNMRIEHSFEETALIAFGVLVDEWVDELVTESVVQMFMETPEEEMADINSSDGESSSSGSSASDSSIEASLSDSSD